MRDKREVVNSYDIIFTRFWQKNEDFFMRIKPNMPSIVPSLLVATALAGCSTFQPDYYNCDKAVTSYAEGVRSSLATQLTGQGVEVRLNGVSAQCYDDGAGFNAEVAIGMKVARNLAEGSEVDPVIVPLAAAVIDKDDNVLDTESFIYTMQFTKGLEVIYPLVRRDYNVPEGGRLIISLTPELLEK